jgi:hypothetical protein
LYGFVGNDGIDRWDILGWATTDEIDAYMRMEQDPRSKCPCADNKIKIVAISQTTTENDRQRWNGTRLPVINNSIGSTDQLIAEVKAKFDREKNPPKPCKKCIKELHLSGHGSGGGGVFWAGIMDFEAYSINESQANAIRSMMCDDGVIRLWSCNSGNDPDSLNGLKALANKMGIPVSGVEGPCFGGINGGNYSGSNIIWRQPN